jgi:hypothetical protein
VTTSECGSGRRFIASVELLLLVTLLSMDASMMLRFSEDEAFRRVSAARLVRRFPALLDAVASGELHLTGC